MVKTVILFICTLMIVGCGGGGGGSAHPVAVTGLATSDIRIYKQGDSLAARLTITETSSGATAAGDIVMTVGGIVTNPFGVDCRAIIYSGSLTGPGGTAPYLIRALFFQDSNGSLYECGGFDDDLGRYVFLTDTSTSPNGVFLETKSPLQIGDSTSGVVFYDDGSWEDCTQTVSGIENVSVPLGTYQAYIKNQSCSYSDGDVLINTIWVVPGIFSLKESGSASGLSLSLEVTNYTFN